MGLSRARRGAEIVSRFWAANASPLRFPALHLRLLLNRLIYPLFRSGWRLLKEVDRLARHRVSAFRAPAQRASPPFAPHPLGGICNLLGHGDVCDRCLLLCLDHARSAGGHDPERAAKPDHSRPRRGVHRRARHAARLCPLQGFSAPPRESCAGSRGSPLLLSLRRRPHRASQGGNC